MPRDPTHLVPLGRALATARAEAGLSQRELARRTDVNHNYISQLEKGERDPSYSVLVQLCEGLGVPLSTITDAAAKRP